MKGVVHGISRNGVRCSALTDYGFTVFDITSGETFVGDVIIGNLDDHGDANLVSESTGQTIDVYIEAIQATRESAQHLLESI